MRWDDVSKPFALESNVALGALLKSAVVEHDGVGAVADAHGGVGDRPGHEGARAGRGETTECYRKLT